MSAVIQAGTGVECEERCVDGNLRFESVRHVHKSDDEHQRHIYRSGKCIEEEFYGLLGSILVVVE